VSPALPPSGRIWRQAIYKGSLGYFYRWMACLCEGIVLPYVHDWAVVNPTGCLVVNYTCETHRLRVVATACTRVFFTSSPTNHNNLQLIGEHGRKIMGNILGAWKATMKWVRLIFLVPYGASHSSHTFRPIRGVSTTFFMIYLPSDNNMYDDTAATTRRKIATILSLC